MSYLLLILFQELHSNTVFCLCVDVGVFIIHSEEIGIGHMYKTTVIQQ